MVAVRSAGLAFESLLGVQDAAGQRKSFVSPEARVQLVEVANERFVENTKRVERFRRALLEALRGGAGRKSKDGDGGEGWEDPVARRERKRAEGLRRREGMLAVRNEADGDLAAGAEVDDALGDLQHLAEQ